MSIERKRILFIDGPLGGGGAERVLLDILRNIDYSKYDVDLAVICRGGILMDEVPEQVNIIELWNGYSWGYKLAIRMSKWFHNNWLLARKMNGTKLRRDYDIEISFWKGCLLNLEPYALPRQKKPLGCMLICSRIDMKLGQFYPGEEEHDYNRMDYVINVSKDCEDAFKKRFPDCTAQPRVIYNPIDREKILKMAEEYSVSTSDDDLLTIITVGRLTPQKKPERLLQVAQMAKNANLPVRFKWVGDGELRTHMEQQRDEMGLLEMVEFTGFTKNPFPHIKAADIMMATSDFEGFCLVICEAMCLGVQVISTRTVGPTEILGNNEFGEITDISAEALFEALKRWVEQPELRESYATKALKRPDIYSVSQTLESIDSLIGTTLMQ